MDIASIIYECKVKPNTYALVCRPDWKGLKQLFDTHIKLAEPSKVDKTSCTYHFANGSKIWFGVIGEDHDVDKYMSIEFHFIDEDSIKEEYANILRLRLRYQRDGFPKV